MEKSILDILRDTVIFEYDKERGCFDLFEYEDYCCTTLTIDQMMRLSQEIAELAQKATQEGGQGDA